MNHAQHCQFKLVHYSYLEISICIHIHIRSTLQVFRNMTLYLYYVRPHYVYNMLIRKFVQVFAYIQKWSYVIVRKQGEDLGEWIMFNIVKPLFGNMHLKLYKNITLYTLQYTNNLYNILTHGTMHLNLYIMYNMHCKCTLEFVYST